MPFSWEAIGEREGELEPLCCMAGRSLTLAGIHKSESMLVQVV